jgi:chromosome segregation ATPase
MNLIINPQFESLCPPLSEERDAACDEAQEARAEADHAKTDQVRLARDVANMFDDLRAVADRHAEMHVDRAQLQTDVDRLAAELEQARRP